MKSLLSGNVTAVVADGNLTLQGDADDNNVEIVNTTDGVVVRGLNGTTVNGMVGEELVFAGEDAISGSLFVSLGAGNDRIQLDDVDVAGDVDIRGEAGDDILGATSLAIGGDLFLSGGRGADTIMVNNVEVAGDVGVRSGAKSDLIVVQDSNIDGKLVIKSGAGSDNVSIQSTTVGHKTKVKLGAKHDTLLISDTDLGRKLKVFAGFGDDLVQIEDSTATHKTKILGMPGDDAVIIDGDSDLGRRLVVRNGVGNDTTEIGPDVLPTNDRRIRNSENDVVDPDLLDSRINEPNNGLLVLIDAAIAEFPTGNALLNATFASSVTDSNGVVIVNNATLQFNVTGKAGLVVEVDRDGDDAYDDGMVTLDAQGMGILETTLLHDDTNLGLNNLKIRGVDGGSPLTSAPLEFAVHYAVGTVVRYSTDLGNFDVELLDADAPIAVQNFLNYDERFDGSIIHRSARTQGDNDFIIQGGGFDLVPPLQPVATDAAIQNEFDFDNSNMRGTLSMALPPNTPNGGTSQWFINVADNIFLDNDQHTVFGRVIGTGMNIVDAIHALETFNLIAPLGNTALGEVPLHEADDYEPFSQELTGTVSTIIGSTTVTGIGTLFTTELTVNAEIEIDNVIYQVAQILNDTSLLLATNATTATSGESAFTNPEPDDDQFVQLNIDVLLTPSP